MRCFRNSFTAVVYNPSATNRTFPVRIPVLESKEYTILDEMQNPGLFLNILEILKRKNDTINIV